MKTFAEVNAALSRLYANSSPGPYKLDAMRALMRQLGNPQERLKIIHIAGTSGKTSTAYFTAALLTTAGYKVGLTVSPHVDQVNERVQINMVPVAELTFCTAMTEFWELIEANDNQPSYFEFMTAFAYWYFARDDVDYAVVEVGLGGLLDATNIIERSDKVCVITDIGLDHVAILGNTLAKIAAQKAGIIHHGNQVLAYAQSTEIDEVIDRQVAQAEATLSRLQSASEHEQYGQAFQAELPDYQQRNWLLAYAVYRFVQQRDDLPALNDEQLQATQAVQVPGRMDTRTIGDKTLIMDAAHNAQKFGAFLASYRQLYPDTKPAILLALKQDKETIDIIPGVVELASRIILTSFDTAMDLPVTSIGSNDLAKQFRRGGALNVTVLSDIHEAYQALLAGPEKNLVITGSIYLLSQLRHAESLASSAVNQRQSIVT